MKGDSMNLSQLKSLVKHGESNILEFKKSTGQRSQSMQTACAFLNSDVGGTILFGVTDNGKIIGQEVSDKTNREIAGELDKIEPHADITIKHISVGSGKYVIVLSVKSGKNKPYFYDGRIYLRNQSTTRQVSREEYIYMIQNTQQPILNWEKMATNGCTTNDLDKKRIKDIVRLAVANGRLVEEAEDESISEVLQGFELLNNERVTNAAVVLFCKPGLKQFIQSSVQLARFDGLTKSEFIDRKDLRGNLFDLLEQTMQFLTFFLPISGKVVEDQLTRVDTPAIPFKALRESILNALIHRDYSMEGASIDVAIYDDRVEIDSPGRLPHGIKLGDLTKKHKSIRRNQIIANVLFTAGKIEKWGRGTLDMIKLCKQSGNPPPIFEETSGSFSVIFPLKESLSRHPQVSIPSAQLTDRQKEIVEILKSGSMSTEQIIDNMKMPPALRTVQLELSKMKQLGIISSTSKGRGRFVLWKLA